jgi:hypothetical protein
VSLSSIGIVNSTDFKICRENDTQTPVHVAFLLQQKLTEINHADHILITYPDLGHESYSSSQWQASHGPIQEYVLADLYSWLESHSGFTHPITRYSSSSLSSSSIGQG